MLWFIISFLFFLWLFSRMPKTSRLNDGSIPHPNGVGPCNLHKWEYVENRLKCSTCNKYPGEM